MGPGFPPGQRARTRVNSGQVDRLARWATKQEIEAMKDPVQARIEREISEHDVVLFMKGTPVFPQCGFSSIVVQVLSHLGVKFKGIDVLSDSALRQGIKAFSDWPTVPQLYVKGEFIGGCDIVREMFETDELAPFLAARGVKTGAVPA
jgi:monothiol glutaredoxin